MIVEKLKENDEPVKRTTDVLVVSLITNLDKARGNLYSSKQTKKVITDIIVNSGLKNDLKSKYISKLEKLLNKGINQLEVIGSIIYSIKEDFDLLKPTDYEVTTDNKIDPQ